MLTDLNLTPTRKFLSPTHRKINFAAAIMGRGPNTDEQRIRRRKNLLAHCRTMRMKNLEGFRHLEDDDLDLASLVEIKRRLSQGNLDETVDVQQLDVIISQVVAELELLIVEQYEIEYTEEVNSHVMQLMNSRCLVCKSAIVQDSSICKNCTDEMVIELQDVLPNSV